MKTPRQTQREARRLFQFCQVDGRLDERRVRQVVGSVIAAGRTGGFATLSRFQRLVRLDRDRHRADVASPTPLPADVRAAIEAGLTARYGSGISVGFSDHPALIGGVRITVGSDVYDGSVRGRLAALEARL